MNKGNYISKELIFSIRTLLIIQIENHLNFFLF